MDVVWRPRAAGELFGPIRRVYIFHGEDDCQKDEALAQLRAHGVDEGFVDFDFETVDADTRAVEDILAAAGIAPIGSPVRLVVVRKAEVYRKRDRQGDAERLAAGISRLGGTSCLALRVGAEEDEKSRKVILTAKLDAACRAQGVAVVCRALSEQALLDWLSEMAARAGKRLEDDAAERLLRAAPGDRLALSNELEKAICMAGDGRAITLEIVEQTCSYDPEDVMFRLVDSIAQRDADRSLRLFRQLLRVDTKPQSVAGRLLALLARQYRLLVQAYELRVRGIQPADVRELPPDVAAELPADGGIAGMAWKARDLFAMARAWDRASLARTFDLLLECDLANKGGGEGSEDVVTNVELLIIALCQLSAGPAPTRS